MRQDYRTLRRRSFITAELLVEVKPACRRLVRVCLTERNSGQVIVQLVDAVTLSSIKTVKEAKTSKEVLVAIEATRPERQQAIAALTLLNLKEAV